MEHKQVEALVTAIDEGKGEVTAVFSVFGNIDSYKDRIMPGAFAKTFQERGHKVAVLDNHSTISTGDVVGKTISLRELKQGEVPPEITARFPMATGAAEIVSKFEPDPQKDARSAATFYRLKNGWVKDWSFGYDAKDYDYSEEVLDGKSESIRNLRTIKLYEVSPVIWGANDGAMTTGVKTAPTEDKPYGAVRRGGKWQVFKLDADGKPTGESLGEHDSEAEADEQVSALYANEKPKKPGKSEDKSGRVLAKRNVDRIKAALTALQEALADAGLEDEEEPEEEEPKGNTGPQEPTAPTSTEAGPQSNTAPVDYIKLIEIEQQKLILLEV